MRHVQALVGFVVIGLFSTGLAHAQGAPAAGPASKVWAGGHLGLSPIGTLEASALGMTASTDTATAFELGGLIEFHVAPIVSIGFAPTLLLNVKGTDSNQSGRELDLPLRVAVGSEVAPRVRLYGFVTPGYSILFPPPDLQGDTTHPSGFMVGFGGGIGYQVAPRFMVTGELGYQFRFLKTTEQGIDVSLDLNYLTFSAGAVVAID
jgi:hypothetical protein